MKKIVSFLLTVVSVFAYTTAFSDDQIGKTENPPSLNSELARIRLFGQNAVGVTLYKNSSCNGGSESIRVSGGIGSAFSSFFGSVKNESIGIPETNTTKTLSQRDGILSKAYFKEYAIEPGKPVTVTMGFQDPGLKKYCKAIAATFIPDPKFDYEGRLDLDQNNGVCVFLINQVSADGTLTPIKFGTAEACH